MTTTAAPLREIRGLTIACDRCENVARFRHETKADAGFDVHWTCADHWTDALPSRHRPIPSKPNYTPKRYAVLRSQRDGRRYLDDGSNFVTWVDGMTPEQIVAAAHADIARHQGYMDAYVAALDEGRVGAHAGCDHAYGICGVG